MSWLIPDLVPLIVAHVDSRSDLARCARLSKDWLKPTRTKLYKNININSKQSLELAVRSFTSSPHLESYVKAASVAVYDVRMHLGMEHFAPADIAPLLSHLPELTELTIVELGNFDGAVEAALCSLARLERLIVRVDHRAWMLHEYDGAAFARVLSSWPKLTKLELHGCYFSKHNWMTPVGPTQLTSLKVIVGGLSDSELDWLAKSSASTLREFSYVEHDGPLGIVGAPGVGGNRPQELTAIGLVDLFAQMTNVEVLDINVPALTPVVLRKVLPKLEQLRILFVPVTALGSKGVIGASATLHRLMLKALDPSNREGPAIAKAALDHLRECPLEQVKTVVLVDMDGSYWKEVEEEMIEVCKRRKVRLARSWKRVQ